MDENLIQQAISDALAGEWKRAISTNKEILKLEPEDIDSLNRLARAYVETGDVVRARKTANKVLKLDPYNPIANKSLKRWIGLRSGARPVNNVSVSGTFLEEPGKTHIVSLLHIAGKKILNSLDAGDEVLLNPHRHRVSITTKQGKYVGRLPDDLSARLRKLIAAGNEYVVYIKSVDEANLRVFIKENKRVPKLANVASFPSEKIEYIAFTPPELVHKKSDRPLLTQEEE